MGDHVFDPFSKQERACFKILIRDDPFWGSVTWCKAGIQSFLCKREKHAQWGRRIWGALRNVHNDGQVQNWEHRLLSWLFAGPLFDPLQVLILVKQRGGLIPNDLRDEASATQVQFYDSVRGVLVFTLLFAVCGLSGLVIDLGPYFTVLFEYTLEETLGLPLQWVWLFARIETFVTTTTAIVCFAIMILYYSYWFARVLLGFLEYTRVVREVKRLLY